MDQKHELQHVVDHTRVCTGICMHCTYMYIYVHILNCVLGVENWRKLVGFGFIDIENKYKSTTTFFPCLAQKFDESRVQRSYSHTTISWNGLLGANWPKKTHYLVTLNLHWNVHKTQTSAPQNKYTTTAASGPAPPAGAACHHFQPAADSHVTWSPTSCRCCAWVGCEASQLTTWHTVQVHSGSDGCATAKTARLDTMLLKPSRHHGVTS